MIKNIQNKLSLPFLVLSTCVNQAGLGCLFEIYKNKLNNWGLSVHIVLSTPFIWLFLLNNNKGEKRCLK
jgi:hypothetical protein